jgi:hypothetical protein
MFFVSALLLFSSLVSGASQQESDKGDSSNAMFLSEISLEDLINVTIGSRRLAGGYTNQPATPTILLPRRK